MSSQTRDAKCCHILKRGPRKGQQCGVGCSSVVGRCAKHKDCKGETTSTSTVITCSICLDDVKFPHTKSVKTECGHIFHAECLGNVRGDSCPNCRASLGRPSESPPVIDDNNFHVIIVDENENPVFLNLVESGIVVTGPNTDPYFLATSQPWLMIDALLMSGREIPTLMGEMV